MPSCRLPATGSKLKSGGCQEKVQYAKRIVLAYSGGLDTSVAIPWLKDKYAAEVIAVALDLGQGAELNQVRERAIAAGAARCHVLDVREEFARDYILPALQADALYEERYPLATALGRPLIAKKLIEIARMENAAAIAHGGTDKGNDQVRIDVSARAIDPRMTVIAPAREWEMTRSDEIEYARVRNVAVPATTENPYRVDRNLWGRSIECGVLEDPWTEPPDDIYTLTKSPAAAPDVAAYVQIEWQNGVPVAVSGVEMSLVELIASLETIAGVHGVGRIDMVENRVVGIKSRPSTDARGAPSRVEGREIYEAPAALLLHMAHREIEGLVVSKDLQRLKQRLSQEYADLVYNGLWFSQTRAAIDAFMQSIQQRVTGTIRLKLFKGDCRVVGRKSPFALYDHGRATDEEGDTFDHTAAERFIKIWGLPVETAAKGARRQAAPVAK
jgi:argininosuccinate synthase